MYLFFDTETTWLPKNRKAPVSDTDNRPRMVQIARLIYDQNWNKLKEQSLIIQPEWYTIPEEASNVHRITTERAIQEGVNLSEVLQEFQNDIESVETVVAHNFSFDQKIVWAEFHRKSMQDNISTKNSICTMQSSTNYCAIPWKYWNKRPNLTELHQKLFWKDFEEAHDALADVEACANCFRELKNLNII